MKYIIGILSFLLCCVGLTHAHSFNEEVTQYILSTSLPSANWSEFAETMEELDSSFPSAITDLDSKIATALSLPQKKLLPIYAKENPDFTIDDVTEWIGDDPMLLELGVEEVYAYLRKTNQPGSITQTNEISSNNDGLGSDFVTSLGWGWDHILSGYDHLLFVLALIIVIPGWKYILKVVTTFTVAHTLTILLGSMGWISLPSIFVEGTIVVSIILAALLSWNKKVGSINDTTTNISRREIGLIFALGLIHGLGFSSFFLDVAGTSANDLIVPLLGFNLGVELGQIAVIIVSVIVLIGIYALAKDHKQTVKRLLIITISLIALYWLIDMLLTFF